MLGAGTQEFPYIPENWEDFVTAVGTADAYVSLPVEGGTYDMNEIAPEGNFTLNINCAEIQGNEWIIAKAYNIDINLSGSVAQTINNLHLQDFLHDKTAAKEDVISNYSNTTFYCCKFSGILASGGEFFGYDGGTINRCSFNVKFIGDSHLIVSAGDYMKFKFCQFKFDHSACTTQSHYSRVMRLSNCYVEDSPTKEGYYIYPERWNSQNSVVVSDNGNFIIINGGDDKYTVTDEQLRDAAYLSSLGFPIVQ